MSDSFKDQGGGLVQLAEGAAGAVCQHQAAVRDLYLGMRFAARLAYRFHDLGDAAAAARVIAAQAATVGIEGQAPDAGDQAAVSDKFAPFAALAEAEIFQ